MTCGLWIHGRQYQSEVPRYYTDYYATLTSHVAILITFSAHRENVEQYRPEFETMISTLKVQQTAFPTRPGAGSR